MVVIIFLRIWYLFSIEFNIQIDNSTKTFNEENTFFDKLGELDIVICNLFDDEDNFIKSIKQMLKNSEQCYLNVRCKINIENISYCSYVFYVKKIENNTE